MIINHPLVLGEVKEIKPRIFAVIIKDDYDRAMLFCRYQEFYESPFDEIRGEYFTLEELMRIYTKKKKKSHFTYPSDWGGYNIPSDVLLKAFKVFAGTKNQYDKIMYEIGFFCEKKTNGLPFYLIGVDKLKSKTMNHEIAHGLYYTNHSYKEVCNTLINDIPIRVYNRIKKELIKIGYFDDKKIIDDEIQAFLSTGLIREFDDDDIKNLSKKFIKNFKNHI